MKIQHNGMELILNVNYAIKKLKLTANIAKIIRDVVTVETERDVIVKKNCIVDVGDIKKRDIQCVIYA